MSDRFQAMIVADVGGKPKAAFGTLALSDLPDHEVLVEVAYSCVNYKDGLALTGRGRIARRLPMVAGADLAGTVVESRNPAYRPGDKIIVTGWGLSETEWGGYARYQRVKAEWITPLPEAFSLKEAMAIGTAGFTAALSADALEEWDICARGAGEILVTGAAGGVGSMAVALLAAAGHRVIAATGRPETQAYLADLGAAGFVDRAALAEKGPALQKERWAGAVDSVGSTTLANVLAQTAYGGAVAACGLASGPDLPATVMPHILRGVSLLGIESVFAPAAKRARAWARLARDLDRAKLAAMTRVEPFARLPEIAAEIIAGQVRGRVVIDLATEGAA
ncbi:MDR family oxidoreductase [Aquabacter spiritensis]|uniref:Acrylyl-CoA reductase (NADPH) n=1 Tax=Aquabacter spiritensis TaxID=933073 RepID=A0A4R3LP74_9HYPH|nr:MDR family oxidoreductase [Aquabacter spiritensis]TCT02214.1 acrylyl-CoA reductase (NADPH) [Aquabacter spiritensis]